MVNIEVDVDKQRMRVYKNGLTIKDYVISSGTNGVGEQYGSECTPRGKHIIRAKIGADSSANTVFIGRRPTGEVYTPSSRSAHPDRDWILTRILWLSGTEIGKNRLGKTDTMRRYIYIHGTPDDVQMGKPGSRGCIRMRNQDIVELFEIVEAGTQVDILEGKPA